MRTANSRWGPRLENTLFEQHIILPSPSMTCVAEDYRESTEHSRNSNILIASMHFVCILVEILFQEVDCGLHFRWKLSCPQNWCFNGSFSNKMNHGTASVYINIWNFSYFYLIYFGGTIITWREFLKVSLDTRIYTEYKIYGLLETFGENLRNLLRKWEIILALVFMGNFILFEVYSKNMKYFKFDYFHSE